MNYISHKNINTLHLFILFIFFCPSFYFGQEIPPFACGSDEINSAVYREHPEWQQGIDSATDRLRHFTAEYIQQPHTSRENNPYIIPVVFHVIHENGSGNISTSQLLDGLKQVNEQYRKRNADTVNIVEDFKHLAADCEIEFRMAQLDPDGNCTSGITRTYSPLTNTGGHVVKDLIHWPSDKYLNIYVCNNVGSNLAGHCLMPGVADTIPEWDGIVIQHSYIGTIGTSNVSKKTVLSHEIGHYLNLYHIWGGNNVPGFFYLPVGDPGNCEYDDEVEDTPNTIGWSSCNLSGNSCSSLDMVQNYMDYSYCSNLFTEGQKLRMHAALNSEVANRNNLWSESNLIATGLANESQLCKAIIEASDSIICLGGNINYSDLSLHKVSERQWTFTGGNITSSSDSSLTVNYTNTGIYTTTLTVSDGITTHTKIMTINVLENNPSKNKIMDNFDNLSAVSENWTNVNNAYPISFKPSEAGFEGSCLFIDGTTFEKAKYSLESVTFDASEYTDFAVSFDFAYAKSSNAINEKILLELSKDCGQSWSVRRTINMLNDFSIETDEPFFPQTQSDWIHKEIIFPISTYNVDNLRFRLTFEHNRGNNFFIDNVNISDAIFLDIVEDKDYSLITLYPNPTKEKVIVQTTNKDWNGILYISNIFGEVVKSKSMKNTQKMEISTNDLASGSYFVRFVSENGRTISKVYQLIIQ